LDTSFRTKTQHKAKSLAIFDRQAVYNNQFIYFLNVWIKVVLM